MRLGAQRRERAAGSQQPGWRPAPRTPWQALHRQLGNARLARVLQRLVDPARVSCANLPRTYPIFAAMDTDDPVGELQAADARAIEMLTDIVDELSELRARVAAGAAPGPALFDAALVDNMRDNLRMDAMNPATWTGSGPGTTEIAIRWLGNIRNALAGGRLRYTCIARGCGDWFAFTEDGAFRINLCRPFWRDAAGMDMVDQRALTLIHEVAHIYYRTEDAGGGLGSSACIEQCVADFHGIVVDAGCAPPAP